MGLEKTRIGQYSPSSPTLISTHLSIAELIELLLDGDMGLVRDNDGIITPLPTRSYESSLTMAG